VRAIPGAQLAIYPDAGHAFHFQHAERFAEDVTRFLASAWRDSGRWPVQRCTTSPPPRRCARHYPRFL